jgi:hypothetical protein
MTTTPTPRGTDLARSQLATLVEAITALGAPVCADADGTEWFALAAVLQAFEIECEGDAAAAPWDPDTALGRVADCAHLVALDVDGERWVMIRLDDVLAHVVPFSQAPVAVAYQTWLCGAFLPALLRSGWYDPPTGHTPPPGQELTALEQREDGRDALEAALGLDRALWDVPDPEEHG